MIINPLLAKWATQIIRFIKNIFHVVNALCRDYTILFSECLRQKIIFFEIKPKSVLIILT